ncbi:MAG: hypothetical protein JWR08_162 [Enterovirga sp.]|jgi:ferric-dicitrate binding protein FerR (iron transport regulator)|nr:hypothetical protein [Enterovirga sp.]
MKQIAIWAAAAALTLGATASQASPAPSAAGSHLEALSAALGDSRVGYAQYRHRHARYRGRRNAAGAAIAAGAMAAIVGGVIASQATRGPRYDYYDQPRRAYGPGYGRGGYYYDDE